MQDKTVDGDRPLRISFLDEDTDAGAIETSLRRITVELAFHIRRCHPFVSNSAISRRRNIQVVEM